MEAIEEYSSILLQSTITSLILKTMSGNFSSIAASNAAVNELTSEVDSLYLEQYAFTTSAAIVGSLNSKSLIFVYSGLCKSY